MQGVVEFIGKAILGKVVGDGVYDGLKVIFGSYFDKLSSYLKNGEREKFETSLEILLEDEEIKSKILDLMRGVNIEDSIKNIKKSEIEIDKDTKIRDSVKWVEDSKIKIR